MPTECSAELFDFGTVEGRAVEAAFDAGLVTSDAGALLLGATDRAIGMIDRFAACFHDERRADLIEHEVATLVGQRVFAIALGYEDLNDHDELRHDPLMAVLAGKLTARREDCGKANDRFLEPIKVRCKMCDVVYARCERELNGLEFALLSGDAVPMHVVVAPGMRMGMEGPRERVRKECERLAEILVQAGHKAASCVFPGTMRRP